MKTDALTYRADFFSQITNVSCALAGALAFGTGLAMQSGDIQGLGIILAGCSVVKYLAGDAIVIDRKHRIIKRRQGIWPFAIEGTKAFSEVDHVLLEQRPGIESDGSEFVETRLSLVGKTGAPIVLALTDRLDQAFEARAKAVADALGVSAVSQTNLG
ncbi:MAG: hypothetical protein P4L46_08965 [Fimbriimonas sp.]|nr:hypothetical protein [Fimbriimonas sp.]